MKKYRIKVDWNEAPSLVIFLMVAILVIVMIIVAVVGILRWSTPQGVILTVVGIVSAAIFSLLLPWGWKNVKFFYRDSPWRHLDKSK